MGADYSFYVKTIETHARAFFKVIIFSIGSVFWQTSTFFVAAEEAPLIPTPVGFQPDCSILDNVSILFLNNKILLELRKTWRFLYSSKTSDRDFVELSKSIQYEGPTLIVVRTTNDTILGM